MSLELNDSFHIIIRNGCLVNFVSEGKEKRPVLKVCESWGWGVGLYKAVCMCPWLYFCTVTSIKIIKK